MESFNLGRHIDDEKIRADAMINRQRLCQALGFEQQRLAVPEQVHSNNVIAVERVPDRSLLQNVDGVVTNVAGLPILLYFADCVPVILFDPVAVALGVVHAGWRGTASRIVIRAVEKMGEAFGSEPGNIKAAIGPAIGSCCYPTSVDVAQKLSATVSDAKAFIVYDGDEKQPRPDLKAVNAMQLLEAGVGEVDVADLCTACLPSVFYSHRQSGGNTGRQGAIAQLGHRQR